VLAHRVNAAIKVALVVSAVREVLVFRAPKRRTAYREKLEVRAFKERVCRAPKEELEYRVTGVSKGPMVSVSKACKEMLDKLVDSGRRECKATKAKTDSEHRVQRGRKEAAHKASKASVYRACKGSDFKAFKGPLACKEIKVKLELAIRDPKASKVFQVACRDTKDLSEAKEELDSRAIKGTSDYRASGCKAVRV